MRAMGLGVVAALAVGASADAQAWFGVPTPGPVTPVDQPTFVTGPEAYGPAPFAGRPKDDATGALKGERLLADVKTIVGFSLARRDAGDPLWGRISGLPGEAATVDWAVAQLKAAGLKDAHAETYVSEQPLWLPKTWTVRLKSEGSPDAVLQSAAPIRAPTTKPLTASGPLVFAGRGSPAELANIDVK